MSRAGEGRGREMCEQRLTDGWGSYYTAGRTCHLLPVACLSLPLVSFMAVITEWMHGQTAPPEIPISHIKHMHTDTHTQILTFHCTLSRHQDGQDTVQVGEEVIRKSYICQGCCRTLSVPAKATVQQTLNKFFSFSLLGTR